MEEKFSLSLSRKSLIWVDPRTKLILLISANIAIMIGVPVYIECLMVVFTRILLLMFKKKNMAVAFLLAYLLMLLGQVFILPLTSGVIAMLCSLVFIMLKKFIPCLIIGGFIISTTKVSEFVASMKRIKVSEKVIIPFAVMFRFFPTVKEEWESIKDAMKMRGIGITFKKVVTAPLTSIEYLLVPLMISTVKIGEELSAAALSRGLESNGERTNICKIGFSLLDVLIICMALFFIVFAVCRKGDLI